MKDSFLSRVLKDAVFAASHLDIPSSICNSFFILFLFV